MSPGTGSISSCHCRSVRHHQAATAWLLSCPGKAQPFPGPGRASHLSLCYRMPCRCCRMSELTIPWVCGSSLAPLASAFLLPHPSCHPRMDVQVGHPHPHTTNADFGLLCWASPHTHALPLDEEKEGKHQHMWQSVIFQRERNKLLPSWEGKATVFTRKPAQ